MRERERGESLFSFEKSVVSELEFDFRGGEPMAPPRRINNGATINTKLINYFRAAPTTGPSCFVLKITGGHRF
jgi:hypothetical protein